MFSAFDHRPDDLRTVRRPVARSARPIDARLWLLGIVGCFSLSCASTNLPSISSLGPDFEPLPAEEELWDEARSEERTLQEHVEFYDDPEFAEYSDAILARLTSSDSLHHALDLQVYLIQDDAPNVFSYPHGPIYLHTGLLSRLEGEDQLAAVLAHELVHIEDRDAFRQLRQAKNTRGRSIAFGVAATAALIALDLDAIDDGDWHRHLFLEALAHGFLVAGDEILTLAAQESIAGYGDQIEAAADRRAFERLDRAGYDVEGAALLFDRLLEEPEELDEFGPLFYADRGELEVRRDRVRLWLDQRAEQLVLEGETMSLAEAATH